MQLAQLNISRMLASDINHPLMADFVAQLDTINKLAEQSDGFIWRLTGDGNDATSLRPFDDERIIVNMSVWNSLEQLKAFVFDSLHTLVMKDRRKWFEKPDQMTTVLWWDSDRSYSNSERSERTTPDSKFNWTRATGLYLPECLASAKRGF